MSLTPIEVTASSSGSTVAAQPDTQIASATSTSNTIMYTVPAGRKAELYFGHQYSSANQNDYYLLVDVAGVLIRVWGGLSGQSASYRTLTTPLVTLLAGSIVKTQSSNSGIAYILGVEKDA